MRRNKITVFVILAFCLTIASGNVLAYEGRVLERGMHGSDVAEIQEMLDSLGYTVGVDGIFGPGMESALETFQQDSGLTADGIVGADTLAALRALGQHQVHKVSRGDALSTLAKKYGTTVSDIMDANDMTDGTIYIGQKLVIPAPSYSGTSSTEQSPAVNDSKGSPVMMTYQVQPGESTYIIARKFNTSVAAIAEANGLKDPSRLSIGDKLLIPTPKGGTGREDLIWPVMGRITSDYGWRTHPVYRNRQFHGGIDIAIPTGTGIKAAASGRVIRAGNMDGFGLGIVIDHGKGVTTWYGHNSVLLVKAGESVVKGQVIAKSGKTGVATGPHLDFRIKVDGNTVNPLGWLPKK